MQVKSLLAAALLVGPGVLAAPASLEAVAPVNKREASDNVEKKSPDGQEGNEDWYHHHGYGGYGGYGGYHPKVRRDMDEDAQAEGNGYGGYGGGYGGYNGGYGNGWGKSKRGDEGYKPYKPYKPDYDWYHHHYEPGWYPRH
ncbi:uncharacterized protein F4807DRAFT_305618 [Annulohypoxylon truncatum]|uniref:uncharacterized protein n=1 Tax=Annulohypoxylon truncatum TaxID=327061 RepID=UPI00200838D9|nr:uncharacterized protein F4807DRAFT_305618 [Annulohypoxylon truncatum]KAI1212950.1 hypothetical protein F4807DRAFT_305618 [Annulohypoxylon truncatum]